MGFGLFCGIKGYPESLNFCQRWDQGSLIRTGGIWKWDWDTVGLIKINIKKDGGQYLPSLKIIS